MLSVWNKFNTALFRWSLVLGAFLYTIISQKYNFTYVDEIIMAILLIEWIFQGKKNKEFIFFFCIALMFLANSLITANNIIKAVIMDFVIQCKPFVAFYCVYNLPFIFSESEKRKLCRMCIIMALLMIPIGIYNLSLNWQNTSIFVHTGFVSMSAILALVYYYFSQRQKKNLVIATLILTLGFLTLRSKFFGFYVVYICIMFFSKRILRLRGNIFKFRNLLFLAAVVSLAVYFSWEKIYYYFYVGGIQAQGEIMARPMLYYGMVQILKDYPLLGSGFGTFATYISGQYYSPLYARYGLDRTFGLMEGASYFMSDTFFPALSQVGLIGIFFYVMFWRKRFQEGHIMVQRFGDVLTFKYIILIFSFFFIESIADSTFTHNRGMVMMMFLAIVLKNSRYQAGRRM